MGAKAVGADDLLSGVTELARKWRAAGASVSVEFGSDPPPDAEERVGFSTGAKAGKRKQRASIVIEWKEPKGDEDGGS